MSESQLGDHLQYKKEERGQNLDVAIPEGCGVRAVEHGKVEKYQVLARKV